MKIKLLIVATVLTLSACTQETQNQFGRALQNWTGTDGILEIYAGEKLVKRFMKINKLTTTLGIINDKNHPYGYGYGYGQMDINLNGKIDNNESENIYFEFSSYSTSYIFTYILASKKLSGKATKESRDAIRKALASAPPAALAKAEANFAKEDAEAKKAKGDFVMPKPNRGESRADWELRVDKAEEEFNK